MYKNILRSISLFAADALAQHHMYSGSLRLNYVQHAKDCLTRQSYYETCKRHYSANLVGRDHLWGPDDYY
jgi:hypothetical protein